MTHGRTAKTRVNRRRESGGLHLTGFSESAGNLLESRVARLEERIEQMQEEINRMSGVMPAKFREAIDSIGQKHPGPDKKIDDTELILNRNNLVLWLEKHWPYIVKPLLAAKSAEGIVAVLSPIATTPDIRPTWQNGIMSHPAALLEFLRSRKFRRRPPKKTGVEALRLYHSEKRDRAANRLPTRQIANAMAGVPRLKWRTSLDKCSRTPSTYNVRHETATYYRTLFGILEDVP